MGRSIGILGDREAVGAIACVEVMEKTAQPKLEGSDSDDSDTVSKSMASTEAVEDSVPVSPAPGSNCDDGREPIKKEGGRNETSPPRHWPANPTDDEVAASVIRAVVATPPAAADENARRDEEEEEKKDESVSFDESSDLIPEDFGSEGRGGGASSSPSSATGGGDDGGADGKGDDGPRPPTSPAPPSSSPLEGAERSDESSSSSPSGGAGPRDALRRSVRTMSRSLTPGEVGFLLTLAIEGDEVEVEMAKNRLEDQDLFFERHPDSFGVEGDAAAEDGKAEDNEWGSAPRCLSVTSLLV